MKLIDLLVRDLPGHGGWRDGAQAGAQDKDDRFYFFSKNAVSNRGGVWFGSNENAVIGSWIELKKADDWDTAVITREQYEAALEAASKPVWDGEGLPPIGCECEISTPLHNAGTRVRVLCHDEGSAVCRILEGDDLHSLCGLQAKEIQPIRTAAERKREAAVDKILELMELTRESPTRWGLDKIYNWIAEGKIPGIRLEDEAGR